MVLRVAAHHRKDARRVYRRMAFSWLCVQFCLLLEREDDRDIQRHADRLHLAILTNHAVNAPEKLADDQRALEARREAPVEAADAKAAGLAMLARAHAAGTLRPGVEAVEAPSDGRV